MGGKQKDPSPQKGGGGHIILLVLLVIGAVLGSALFLVGEPLLRSFLDKKGSSTGETYVAAETTAQTDMHSRQTETKAPETQAPQTETRAPETHSPQTETRAPETQAPQTETRAPETQVPQTETRAPETQAPQTETRAPETQAPETEGYAYQAGIHKYDGIKADCDWNEAYVGAQSRSNALGEPGHLLTIETQEELEQILTMLGTDDPPVKEYYLSAARLDTGREYYWIGRDGRSYGECINTAGNAFSSYWYPGEPSFRDLDGTEENRLALMFVRDESTGSGKWYLNDVSSTALKTIESYSGKIGYLVEYE